MNSHVHTLVLAALLLATQARAQKAAELLGELSTLADEGQRLDLLAKAAMASLLEGDHEEASDLANMGMDAGLAMERPGPSSVCSEVLARMELMEGHADAALPHALRALTYGKEAGLAQESRCAVLLSEVYGKLGLSERAADHAKVALATGTLDASDQSRAEMAIARALDDGQHSAEAIAAYTQCKATARRTRNSDMEMDCMSRISAIHSQSGDLAKAVDVAEQMIPLLQVVGTPLETGIAYNNLGELYARQDRYDAAINAFGDAGTWLAGEPEVNDRMLTNLSITLARSGRMQQAHAVIDNVVARIEKRQNPKGLAHALLIRAGIQLLDGSSSGAASSAEKALSVAQKNDLLEDQEEALSLLARIAQERGLAMEARSMTEALNKVTEQRYDRQQKADRRREDALYGILRQENDIMALLNAEQRDRMDLMQTILMAENEGKQIDIDQYKEDLRRSFAQQEALLNEKAEQAVELARATLEAERRENEISSLEGQRQMQVLQLSKLDLERKQKETAMSMLKRQNELLASEQKLKAEEQHRDRLISRFAMAIGAILIGLTVFAFWVMRKVKGKNRTIHHQVEQIEKINSQLSDKNADLLSSINYARNIQGTIIPSEADIQAILPDSFLYYRPRDIVSGDLPYIRQVGERVFLAAIDCTGHGVPAAMLSFMAYYNLNDIITANPTAGVGNILLLLHERIKKAVHENESGHSMSDGMDIGLVELDRNAGTMWFAGAQSALVILRGSAAERIKGSSCSIGDPSGDSSEGFATHQIELQPSDRICLYSDGLIHQFGGPNGRKKFSSTNFMQRLEALNGQSAQEIGTHICSQHIEWQGNEEQTDDIILIGFSINGTPQAIAA